MNEAAQQIKEMMIEQWGELVEFTCDVHGKYMQHEKLDGCPACDEEQRSEKNRQDSIEKHRKMLEARWEDCGFPPKYKGITFDAWNVYSDKMQEMKDAAIAFANCEIDRLMMIGSCGTGKTMLAAAIAGEMAKDLDCYPVYITASRLIRSIRDNWQSREYTEQESMDRYINCSVLIVDELGAGRCTEDDKLIISEILCDRYASDKPTLVISNLNAQQIKESVLDDRAIDRMRMGKVITSNWKSMRKQDALSQG